MLLIALITGDKPVTCFALEESLSVN